jgi:endonuclease YncB( thermonuclease family)
MLQKCIKARARVFYTMDLPGNTSASLEAYLRAADVLSARPFVPALSYGRVVKVYDGDTITVAAPFCNGSTVVAPELFLFHVRLRGIDSPELRGAGADNHERAVAARDALHGLVIDRVVRIANIGAEKYGRVLADVYLDELCVNDWMVDNKFAGRYFGGTKMAEL